MKNIFLTSILLMLIGQVVAQNSSKKYNESENLIDWPAKFDPQVSDFYVHNEIEINASPEIVWDLLIKAKEWSEWYGGIENIRFQDTTQHELIPGTKVFWNSMGQSLNNEIVHFEPYHSLSWQFEEKKIQGLHAWIIVPTPFGCKVITDESQNGTLAKLQKVFLPNKLLKQHDEWLLQLKRKAESKELTAYF
jgi:uncharacterized protein YndB with AHSA1/START domain